MAGTATMADPMSALSAVRPPRRPVLLLLACLWLLLSGLGGWGVYWLAQQAGIADLRASGEHRMDLYAASLEREVDKYAFLPAIVALEEDVQALLRRPDDAGLQQRVNRYLEQLSDRAGTLSVYVVDSRGKVKAASNWRRADSFIGEDLSFRPYYREALRVGSGRYFGIGTTRGEPGYYLTSTLGPAPDRVQGVAVVKVGLAQLEQSWSAVESPVLVSDENSVLILSNRPAWKFTTLQPLDEATRQQLENSQKYNRRALQPLGWQVLRELDAGTALVRLKPEAGASAASAVSAASSAGLFLSQARPLASFSGTPWRMTVLSPLRPINQLALSRAWVAAAALALALLLVALQRQRRRHLREQLAARAALQAAHDALERKVEQRTADLSAANLALQQEVAERVQAEATLRAKQDELVQAGKLAVIGRLSTEMAHELNQPLAALRTLAGNSQRFLERGELEVARGNLQRMADLADRMGRITARLRNFARKSRGEPTRVLLDDALDNALAVLEARLSRAGARIECKRQPQLAAWCDANRVEQVLVNLLGNALDAMRDQPHPCVELECRAVARQVQILVRDHGPGLSAEAQTHLFEPFFTTKPQDEGLGLGLALSADIAQAGGGSLQGTNHPDGGAVFTLSLPALPSTALADTRAG
ncbi:two-component sensor histidine kinase [Comamonas phosphati]|nr:two-component sensor histidine kinase [Comamonas phosphati]